ncbi:uncharacterized protein LOC135475724 [Liolophura sinensis]|uniref:uncharacterized protein LOC135475724 n=1 Tax=Liolophura sinensis TaxID=3198878 RepID=UPI00315828C8
MAKWTVNDRDWSADPQQVSLSSSRSAFEDSLWEELLKDTDHSSAIWSSREFRQSQKTGVSKDKISGNNGPPDNNIVIRYTENTSRSQRKDLVPDSGFLKNRKGPSANNNYKPNSKYGRLCRRSLSQSCNPSMKRGGRGGREGDSVDLYDESVPVVNSETASERKSGYLDEPAYVREALLRDRLQEASDSLDRDGNSGSEQRTDDTGRLQLQETLQDSDTDQDNSEEVDSLDEELWLSAKSLANVTTWMIRNRDHLQIVLNDVPKTQDDTLELKRTAILQSFLTTGGPNIEEDTSRYLDLKSRTDSKQLTEHYTDNHVTPSGQPGILAKPERLVPDAVRNSFHRMRLEFRHRNGSTKSAPGCRRDRFEDSTCDLERDSMKCYMEIVGSDISSQYRGIQVEDSSQTMNSQGFKVGYSSNSPLQSLSELAIIENMSDLLKDIEKSDLVLADNLGWLYHQESGLERWCVIADIIMCIFENKESNKPILSILLPGADIYGSDNSLNPNHTSVLGKSQTNTWRITIDSNIAGQEHTFFAKNSEDHMKWVNALKMASNFDQDSPLCREGLDMKQGNGNCFGSEENFSFNPLITSEIGMDMEISLGSPDSLDSPVLFSKNKHFHLDLQNSCSDLSLQSESSTTSKESGISMLDSSDFKKFLRRDCPENGQSSPLKARPSHSLSFSSPKAFSLDRRHFTSMENIDRIVLRKSNSNPLSNAPATDNGNLLSSTELSPPVIEDGRKLGGKKSSSCRRPLSQSLDLSKITPVTSGLVRRASGFKERMFGKKGKSSLSGITLGSLVEVKMSGFMQHKVLLKWQKLFFVVSRGCLYAFKTKNNSENPEFMAILSNYTITYLLNGRQKKNKITKPYVFKLSQPNCKSIYLCAAHSLDLARWIQVLQMEASQVSVDNPDSTQDSFDAESWVTPGLFAKTNARYALGSPANDLEPCEFPTLSSSVDHEKLSSTCLSDGLEIVSTEQGRVTVSHHMSQMCDNELITAWDTSSSCSTVYSSTLESSSNASMDYGPRHDNSVTRVWQSDNEFRLTAIRKHAQKIKKTFSDRRKKWHSEEVLIDIPISDSFSVEKDDVVSPVKSEESREVKKSCKEESVERGEETGDSSQQVPRRHKPVTVKHLPVQQLGTPDHCGYLERRHQDGAWVKYWYCLKSGWLYCYLTPADFVTVDAINLDNFSVTCHHERFQAKSFVLELHHKRYFPIFLAADSESAMAEWSMNIGEGISTPERSHLPGGTPPTRDQMRTTVLSDDSSVPEDNVDITEDLACDTTHDTDTSSQLVRTAEETSVVSDARQHLLQQVLKLKHDLEQKQSETRRKRASLMHVSQSVPKNLDKKVQEEQLVQEITSLRQRRLSTQLKVDTLQRQMELRTVNTSRKKPLFRFVGRQKPPTEANSNNNSPFMEEQVKELTSRLQVIDQDLTYREKDRQTLRPTWLDLANNNRGSPENQRRHGLFSGKIQKESRKRTQSLKLTGLALSVPQESPRGEDSAVNQRPSVPVSDSNHGSRIPPNDSSLDSISLAKVNKGKGWFRRKRNGKESPQPEPANEIAPGNCLRAEAAQAQPPSPKVSPRREISPRVLADIEEFERMSRLALQKTQGSQNS